jgi:hypothetical protein
MKALALAIVLAACGGGDDPPTGNIDAMVDPDAMPRQIIMENVPLVVNEVVEAVLVGGPGDYARITASVPAGNFDWNIHGHANNDTQIIDEAFKVQTMDKVFAIPAQASWWLLLRNKSGVDVTIQLKVELYNDTTWSGWQ